MSNADVGRNLKNVCCCCDFSVLRCDIARLSSWQLYWTKTKKPLKSQYGIYNITRVVIR